MTYWTMTFPRSRHKKHLTLSINEEKSQNIVLGKAVLFISINIYREVTMSKILLPDEKHTKVNKIESEVSANCKKGNL